MVTWLKFDRAYLAKKPLPGENSFQHVALEVKSRVGSEFWWEKFSLA